MFGLVDSHCHLDFYAFDQDRAEVLMRANKSSVHTILNPGIDLATSRSAVQLTEVYSNLFAAVGVHPNEGQTWTEKTARELRTLARHAKVVAIGEIGLDYYRNQTPRDQQVSNFRSQLALAAELNLPVIIHNRQATADVIEILASWYSALVRHDSPLAERPGVLHSFEGDLEVAQRAMDMHFFLGVSGPITFRNAPERRALFSTLPLEKLLIETDSPFLAPHPYRGQRNEPAYVRAVAETLASIQDTTLSSVGEMTSANAARLFAWRVSD